MSTMDYYMFGCNTATSASETSSSLTKEELDKLIEDLRPEVAIMLNKYITNDKIFEVDNYDFKKYYCKKLLVMSTETYIKRIKSIEKEFNYPVKVYEQEYVSKHKTNADFIR